MEEGGLKERVTQGGDVAILTNQDILHQVGVVGVHQLLGEQDNIRGERKVAGAGETGEGGTVGAEGGRGEGQSVQKEGEGLKKQQKKVGLEGQIE